MHALKFRAGEQCSRNFKMQKWKLENIKLLARICPRYVVGGPGLILLCFHRVHSRRSDPKRMVELVRIGFSALPHQSYSGRSQCVQLQGRRLPRKSRRIMNSHREDNTSDVEMMFLVSRFICERAVTVTHEGLATILWYSSS